MLARDLKTIFLGFSLASIFIGGIHFLFRLALGDDPNLTGETALMFHISLVVLPLCLYDDEPMSDEMDVSEEHKIRVKVAKLSAYFFCTVMIILSGFLFSEHPLRSQEVSAIAEVIEVDAEPSAEYGYSWNKVYVKHSMAGVWHQAQLLDDSRNLAVGDTLKIRYDPKTPTLISRDQKWLRIGVNLLVTTLVLAGITFVLLGEIKAIRKEYQTLKIKMEDWKIDDWKYDKNL